MSAYCCIELDLFINFKIKIVLKRLNLEAWYMYMFSEVEPHYTSLQNGKPVGHTHLCFCVHVCMYVVLIFCGQV